MAIGLSDGVVNLYDVTGSSPRSTGRFSPGSAVVALRSSQALDMVVGSTDEALFSIDVRSANMKDLYELHGECSWCMSADGLAVHVREGRIVSTIPLVGGSIDKRRVRVDGDLLGELSDGTLLFRGYSLVDRRGTTRYFKVPRSLEVVSAHVSRDILACSYPEGVFAVRPSDADTGMWFDVPEAGNIALSSSADTIVALSTHGCKVIELTSEATEEGTRIPLFRSPRPTVAERGMFRTLLRFVATYVRTDMALHTTRGWANLRLNALAEEVKRWEFAALHDRSAHREADNATLVVRSPCGMTAVAYELADAIVLFDASWTELMRIDHLRFSAFDPLLHMDISRQGDYVLVHRASSVTVFRTKDARRVLEVELVDYALESACLGEDGTVCLSGIDGSNDTYGIDGPTTRHETLRKSHVRQTNEAAPIHCYSDRGVADIVVEARKGLKTTTFDRMRYRGKRHSLLYSGGTFYLNGDKGLPFFSDGYDFQRCLREERTRTPNDLVLYIREKNDLSSALYEIGDGLLLLVCIRLSSVILFDTSSLTVVDAYRHHAHIIGSRLDVNSGEVTLFSVVAPCVFTLHVSA